MKWALPLHNIRTTAKVDVTCIALDGILMSMCMMVHTVDMHALTIIAGRGIRISFVRHVNIMGTLSQIAICWPWHCFWRSI
jgi:hypothetical protein